MPHYGVLPSAVESPPSVVEGMAREDELSHRILCCEMIQQVGILLKLPQACIATAQVTMHRFYYRKSMQEYSLVRVAMCSMFLSMKVEEVVRSMRDLFSCFHRVLLIRKRKRYTTDTTAGANGPLSPDFPPLGSLNYASERVTRWRNELRTTELVILKELGYELYVDHPHRFILHYVSFLRLSDHVAAKSWSFLNDSMRTTACVRFKPELIAMAGIFLATRLLQVPLPSEPMWYLPFLPSAADAAGTATPSSADRLGEVIRLIACEIADLYSRGASVRMASKYVGDADVDDGTPVSGPAPAAVTAVPMEAPVSESVPAPGPASALLVEAAVETVGVSSVALLSSSGTFAVPFVPAEVAPDKNGAGAEGEKKAEKAEEKGEEKEEKGQRQVQGQGEESRSRKRSRSSGWEEEDKGRTREPQRGGSRDAEIRSDRRDEGRYESGRDGRRGVDGKVDRDDDRRAGSARGRHDDRDRDYDRLRDRRDEGRYDSRRDGRAEKDDERYRGGARERYDDRDRGYDRHRDRRDDHRYDRRRDDHRRSDDRGEGSEREGRREDVSVEKRGAGGGKSSGSKEEGRGLARSDSHDRSDEGKSGLHCQANGEKEREGKINVDNADADQSMRPS